MTSKEKQQNNNAFAELLKTFEVSEARRDEQQKSIIRSLDDLTKLILDSYITKDQIDLRIGKAKKEILDEIHIPLSKLQSKESLNAVARKIIFTIAGIGGATLIGAIISTVIK